MALVGARVQIYPAIRAGSVVSWRFQMLQTPPRYMIQVNVM